jgi:hypothetical protein
MADVFIPLVAGGVTMAKLHGAMQVLATVQTLLQRRSAEYAMTSAKKCTGRRNGRRCKKVVVDGRILCVETIPAVLRDSILVPLNLT